jgi:uncharacterized membrane protein (UPF0127 family)
MSRYKVSTKDTGQVLATQVKLADNAWARFCGLMLTGRMEGYDGILFRPGNSIHTCFMRYPIDVVFLTTDYEVVKIIRTMNPWRFTRMYFRAAQALELAAGAVPENLREGARLEVSVV